MLAGWWNILDAQYSLAKRASGLRSAIVVWGRHRACLPPSDTYRPYCAESLARIRAAARETLTALVAEAIPYAPQQRSGG